MAYGCSFWFLPTIAARMYDASAAPFLWPPTIAAGRAGAARDLGAMSGAGPLWHTAFHGRNRVLQWDLLGYKGKC